MQILHKYALTPEGRQTRPAFATLDRFRPLP